LSVTARVFSLSGSLVSELPIGTKWLRPYVVAGGGAAFVRFTERHTLFGFSQDVSSNGPMVTAGGGLEIPFGRRIALGVDVRHEWILAADRFDRPDFDAHFGVTVAGAALRVGF